MYNNQVTLRTFNFYAQQYGLKPINKKQLRKLVGEISVKDSQANQIYLSTKSGETTINTLTGYTEPMQHHTYVNTANEVVSVAPADLDKLATIVDELQKASPSHNISWNKVKKIAKDHEIVFSNTKQFHSLVLSRLEELKKSPSVITNSQDKSLLGDVLSGELGLLQVKKRANQNAQRELNKLKRTLTDQTIFYQELENAVQQPQVIKVNDHHTNLKTTNTSLVVVTSDWHIGADVRLTNNKYNYVIAQQRVNNYLAKIKSTINQMKPKSVYIVNLGDLIENVQMRKNQAFTIEMTLGEEITKGSTLQDQFLADLASSYPTIQFNFTEIAGNHDRFAPNSKDSLNGDSVAMVSRLLAKSMSKQFKNLKVINPQTEYRYLLKVNKQHLAFVHGDLDHLNDNNSLAKLASYERTHLDALIGGHLHSLMIKENNGYIIQSGSLIGPTDYSNRLGVYSGPSQVMLQVNEQGITPMVVNL